MYGTIVLINHVPNHSHSFSFYLKNLINSLNFFFKNQKKEQKIRKSIRERKYRIL